MNSMGDWRDDLRVLRDQRVERVEIPTEPSRIPLAMLAFGLIGAAVLLAITFFVGGR